MKIEVRGLSKKYRQGSEEIPVLNGLDFDIQNGEVVAVLGQSGSGKTTLLSLLAGLDRPDQGSIRMDGALITEMNEDQLTEFRGTQVGIIFQSYHLVPHLTALENVMLPLEILGRAETRGPAQQMLASVGLAHRERHFPTQLSGGECQRTALARALVLQPQLLLADEPSGHLDQETGRKVMDLFFAAVRERGTTTLLVTHDPALAERCDRSIHLKSGTLQA